MPGSTPLHNPVVQRRKKYSAQDERRVEKEHPADERPDVKQKIDERFHPDGYNIGINVNEAAGQSVFHVHMHLIPRYKGDVKNPKGGIRGVIPDKQKY